MKQINGDKHTDLETPKERGLPEIKVQDRTIVAARDQLGRSVGYERNRVRDLSR